MRSKHFWISLVERAGKTFCQVLVTLLPIGDGLGLIDIPWTTALSVSGLAALVSALTSVASASIGPDGSPSLVGEPPKQPETLLEDDPAPPVAGRPREHRLDGTPGERPARSYMTENEHGEVVRRYDDRGEV